MTHFSWALDGSIVGLYLLATMIVGIWVRKRVRGVEDFLVAGREMNLYLGIASLAATEFGIITCMYTAQAGYTQGFAGAFPGLCQALSMWVIGVTGFCVKPLRDSGAMTLPELFERRFGKGVRWLSGVVIVMGGLLNMGVFLKIGGEFLCLVSGMDLKWLTLVMGTLLFLVVLYTILGGMMSVLVTDFLQFVIMSVGMLLVTFLILYQLGWDKLVATVRAHHGEGGFSPLTNPTMGWPFIMMQLVGNTAATLTWQAVVARLLAAKDSATGMKVLSHTSFFFVCRWLIPAIWGIAALAVMGWKPLTELTAEQRASLTPAVVAKVEASPVGQPLIHLDSAEKQALPSDVTNHLEEASLHAMPRFLGTFLPIGLMGLLLAAMLAADMSTDSSYMLSWGSVIYNDILAPLLKQPLTQSRGLLWNRCIIGLIGIYLLVFGLFYKIEGNVWSYLLLTGSIYLSSMSALLVGCCYWSKANNWGAYGAILLGALVPVAHLTVEKIPSMAWIAACVGKDWAGLSAFAAAAIGMIVGSLLKPPSRNSSAP